jgi:hypothetical protein
MASDAQKEQAAGALANFALDLPGGTNLIRDAGGVAVLVSLAAGGSDAQTRRVRPLL